MTESGNIRALHWHVSEILMASQVIIQSRIFTTRKNTGRLMDLFSICVGREEQRLADG